MLVWWHFHLIRSYSELEHHLFFGRKYTIYLGYFFFEKHCFYIALCTLYLVLLLRKNMCIFGVFRPNFAHKSLPLSIYMEYTRGIVNLSLFSSTLFFPVSTNFFFKAFCLLESFFYFHCISFENLFHAI